MNQEASLRTFRFRSFVISMIVIGGLGAGAFGFNVSEALAGVVLFNITAYAAAYLGFGSWHDKNVRVASTKEPTP